MNIPRYDFCKENKSLLIQFMKKARENRSNKFCNAKTYSEMSKILPMENMKLFMDNEIPVIDITQSDEENSETDIVGNYSDMRMNPQLEDTLEQSLRNMNETTSEDILYAIRENLETENILSATVIFNLHKPNIDLDGIFSFLSKDLSLEEVLHFGLSLNSAIVNNDMIIICYIRHLLLKKLSIEYSDQLQSSLNDFCKRYPNILKDEITNSLNNTTKYPKVLLQFLDGLTAEFKSTVLKVCLMRMRRLYNLELFILQSILIFCID
ncbi:hypothetical protein JTB14_018468 [Gonioctena quinquepunctata]|nr:hypothetical protein JTB14_018468 [Gonioctena quinquepunctata]